MDNDNDEVNIEDIQRDRKDVDELNRRIIEREKQMTNKIVKSDNFDIEKNLAKLSDEKRRELIDELRFHARHEYVIKRDDQQLELLEQEILDEINYFDLEELTKEEQQAIEEKKKLLKIIKQYKQQEQEDADVYVMPKDNADKNSSTSDSILNQEKKRYNVEDYQKNDLEQFQDSQINRAMQAMATKSHQSELDLDLKPDKQLDAIEFIEDVIENGYNIDELLKPKEEKVITAPTISKYEQIQEVRRSLPIYKRKDELIQAINDYQIIIVVAETGSGKTTQIPQYLNEAGYTKRGMVGCTQPRRLAAMSVAKRVSTEMNVRLGQEVGYSVRFENETSDKTIIKFLTDGMLLREFLTDPTLSEYSVMIIDEAHERTLHTDVLLGLMKDMCRARDDLKLIISSATMDSKKFSEYFDDAPIFNIEGRRFDVHIHHLKAPEADYIVAAIQAVLQIHCSQPIPGDILVFLTGQADIEEVYEGLTQKTRQLGTKIKELVIIPVYSALPKSEQDKITLPAPPNGRKVILATNIAETSLTIDGVRYVIDTGLCKQNSYNPKTGTDSLLVTAISQAAAEQRSGRAGRTSVGEAFRLYTKEYYETFMIPFTIPEIQRTNLASVVLLLKSIGINDILNFDYLDPPPADSLVRALEQLYALGALNQYGELTKMGRKMAEFPCDPQMSKAIIKSESYKCSEEIVTIMSMLDVANSIFFTPKGQEKAADLARKQYSRGTGGDHIALLCIYNEWRDSDYSEFYCRDNYLQYRSLKRARDVREQLVGLCERVEVELISSDRDYDMIRKALCEGYFANVAKSTQNDEYQTLKRSKTAMIFPGSALAHLDQPPKFIIYHELVFTSNNYLRTCSSVELSWIKEIAPHYYNSKLLEENKKKLPKVLGKLPEKK